MNLNAIDGWLNTLFKSETRGLKSEKNKYIVLKKEYSKQVM